MLREIAVVSDLKSIRSISFGRKQNSVSQRREPTNMLSASFATRSLARRHVTRAAVRGMASLEPFEDFGKSVFSGKVADDYLQRHGADASLLKDPTWVKTHSDTVANAVFDW